MTSQREHLQTVQRVKVGLLGLVAVILLISFASAIMRTASREAPVVAIAIGYPAEPSGPREPGSVEGLLVRK